MDCPGENISRALMVLPKLPDATQNNQEGENNFVLLVFFGISLF